MPHLRAVSVAAGICVVLLLLTSLPAVSAFPSPSSEAYPITLPMIMKLPPTPTPIPSPIKNGDFEQGSKVGWSYSDGASVGQTPGEAHSGTKYGLMGSQDYSEEQMTQRVIVPNDAPYLVYWDTTSSEQVTCGYDIGFIWIETSSTTARYQAATVNVFCGGKTYSAYRQHRLDLRQFRGQSVLLIFEMDTSSFYGSYWHIDDVSFSK